MRIPFNQPVRLGTELEAIEKALLNGHTAGDGPFCRWCEEKLERLLGRRTMLVSSATHALEIATILLDLGPGDEVILPSYTFVSTANAVALRGAEIAFADVDRHGCISLADVEQLIGPRTKCILPVHYAGNSCDLEALSSLAGDVPIIEDAAQAIGASFRGQPLGTFGRCAAISFHETKNVGCGEGGALVINAPELRERALYLRDKGTNRRQFLDGIVDKYTWVDLGSSYVLSDLNAAYLSVQLSEWSRIQERRSEIHRRYAAELSEPVERAGAYLIKAPDYNTPNHHLFAIVFRSREQRARYIGHMREHGILTPFHYVALHLSLMGRRYPPTRPLPNSERLSSCLVRLPLFFNLSNEAVDEVIARTTEFLHGL